MQKRITEALVVAVIAAGVFWYSFQPAPETSGAEKMSLACFFIISETGEAPEFMRQRLSEKIQALIENREKFYETGRNYKLPDSELEELFGRIWADNVFKDGEFQLVSYEAADIDRNGQKDLIVMAADGSGLTTNGCIMSISTMRSLTVFREKSLTGLVFMMNARQGILITTEIWN